MVTTNSAGTFPVEGVLQQLGNLHCNNFGEKFTENEDESKVKINDI